MKFVLCRLYIHVLLWVVNQHHHLFYQSVGRHRSQQHCVTVCEMLIPNSWHCQSFISGYFWPRDHDNSHPWTCLPVRQISPGFSPDRYLSSGTAEYRCAAGLKCEELLQNLGPHHQNKLTLCPHLAYLKSVRLEHRWNLIKSSLPFASFFLSCGCNSVSPAC